MFTRLLLTAATAILSASSSPGPAAEIALTDGKTTVRVESATLETSLQKAGGRPVSISAAQPDPGTAKNLNQATRSSASWDLAPAGVSIAMRLSGDELTVEIRGRKDTSFTWPIVHLAPPAEALIWPFWEGRHVPLADERWRTFLKRESWNTTDGLCMPFWGVAAGEHAVTYIATNRFNNEIAFADGSDGLTMSFRHAFPSTESERRYGFAISLSENRSPIQPARTFREWLIRRGAWVAMRDKVRATPKAVRLAGAAHVYLWGDSFLSKHDIKPAQWQPFCRKLADQAKADGPSVARRIRESISAEGWKQIETAAGAEWVDNYSKSVIAAELSNVLTKPEFYEAAAWKGIELPAETQRLLDETRSGLNRPDLCRMNGLLLRAAFPDVFLPVDDWGDGVSMKMLRALQSGGLDRVRICLAGWEGIELRPAVARAADEMGYLFGTYDSFHSIHDPSLAGTDQTWTTAQFDQELYETGAIVNRDGTKRAGFKQRGYLLSPKAARPWVERRVRRNMRNVPYSFYFIDCDAFGQVFDDYSPLHPSSAAQDAAERVSRMSWIRDTFGVVIGSEGGSSFAAPAVHTVEGMLTPVIGWGDPEMADRKSEYYLGTYYPPDGPRVFVQSVPLKDEYVYLHYNPRFRLPLNEIVFHDSVASTHHWGAGSLKFANVRDTTALTELLYQCPPLYHLNLDDWRKARDTIERHYAFFSPVHRELAFAAMTDFAWLTPDRLVQQTTFDDRVRILANFSEAPFDRDEWHVPPRSIAVRGLPALPHSTFTPGGLASKPE